MPPRGRWGYMPGSRMRGATSLSGLDPEICVCSPWVDCYCGGVRRAEEVALPEMFPGVFPGSSPESAREEVPGELPADFVVELIDKHPEV